MIKMLLESAAGSYGYSTGVSEAAIKRYSAEYGAQMIAMETLADQKAIFECAFYDMEVMEFNSYMSGEAVTEGIVDKAKSIFSTIKEKLKKLWEKVKAWFHNVRRFLDGVFMDAADFVKKYKSELKALKLDGFEYQLYKYDFTESITELADVDPAKLGLSDYSSTDTFAADAYDEGDKLHGKGVNHDDVGDELDFDDEGKEEIIKIIAKDDNVTTVEDLRDLTWSALRSGATRGDAKDVTKITNLDTYLKFLEDSRSLLTKIDKGQNKVDGIFKKALKNIDDAEKKINEIAKTRGTAAAGSIRLKNFDTKGEKEETKKQVAASDASYENRAKLGVKYAKYTHDMVSFSQTCINAVIDELRSATVEATKDYKAMVMKAMAYKVPKK